MRNPNGYGSVVRLSGNRRNPFCARKTSGWDDRGYPVYSVIGYYPTREAGLIALAEYNRNPYDLDASKITLAQLHDKWMENRAPKLGKSLLSTLRTGYRYLAPLYSMRYADLRAHHMQDCIDRCGHGYATQASIKNMLLHLERYALELDLPIKPYTALLRVEQPPEDTSRVPFTLDEIHRLQADTAEDDAGLDAALVLLYSGWRISELLALRAEDVDLEEGVMRGGGKTASGKNRVVPIHPMIRPIVERRCASGGLLFAASTGKQYDRSWFRDVHWLPLMKRMGMNHTPHECRHTFRTALDNAGGNKRCIDLIMGHKTKDVGERVYTHKTLDDLLKTILLVTY